MRYAIVILFALLHFACRNTGNNAQVATEMRGDETLPADFMPFYNRFHQDSLFQIQHISWPLKGETSVQVDSMNHKRVLTEWTQENWKMHHPVDFSGGDFKRQFEVVDAILVLEHIGYAAANYSLERRFVKGDTGWELIYYADMMEH
jgi:hypothetical protein